jgi:hypothetical protein
VKVLLRFNQLFELFDVSDAIINFRLLKVIFAFKIVLSDLKLKELLETDLDASSGPFK